ncbi:hypothetical protein C8R43DRAFT_1126337 [Mycena crocata]|nr:hypothetical protein C8R43DRAFT_1126337 [Mycena crocata]
MPDADAPEYDIVAFLGSEIGRVAKLEAQVELLEAYTEDMAERHERLCEDFVRQDALLRRLIYEVLWREFGRERAEDREFYEGVVDGELAVAPEEEAKVEEAPEEQANAEEGPEGTEEVHESTAE